MVKASLSSVGGTSSIPCQGAKIPHSSGSKNKNIKQKIYYNKFNKDLKVVHIKKSLKKRLTGMWSYFPDSLMGCLQTTLGLDIHAFNKCFYTHTQTHTHTYMHTHTHSSALRLWLELLMSSFTLSSRTRANLEFDC